MNGARNDFLTGTGLTLDQDRGIVATATGADLFEDRSHLAQSGAGLDHAHIVAVKVRGHLSSFAGLGGYWYGRRLILHRRHLDAGNRFGSGPQGSADLLLHGAEFERLGNKIVGSAAHGAHGGVHVAVGRHHDHRRFVVLVAQGLQNIQSADSGQAQVGHHQVVDRTMGLGQGFFASLGNFGVVAFGHQRLPEGLPDCGFVIDNQDPGIHQQFSFRFSRSFSVLLPAGRRTRNTV